MPVAIRENLEQRLRRFVRRYRYRGDVLCALCGAHFDEFVDTGFQSPLTISRQIIGMGPAKDMCPVCSGRARTRLILLYLQEQILSQHGDAEILHFAPEYPLQSWIKLYPRVSLTMCDLMPEVYEMIDGVEQTDITALKYADQSFDLVICSHVLEHVPDDRLAMREVMRVLKPGGKAILLAPFAIDGQGTDEDPSVTDATERERRFGQSDHIRIYERDEFVRRVEETGFSVRLFDPYKEHPALAKEMALNPLELLPIAERPKALS